MEIPTHTFPVPEPEAHKLDDVRAALHQKPAFSKAEDFVRAYPWRAMGIAFGLGFIVAKLTR